MNLLQGYKTYIVAAALLVVGLIEGLGGMDIPGVTLQDNWLMVLLGSIGLGSLRAAVSKAPSQ